MDGNKSAVRGSCSSIGCCCCHVCCDCCSAAAVADAAVAVSRHFFVRGMTSSGILNLCPDRICRPFRFLLCLEKIGGGRCDFTTKKADDDTSPLLSCGLRSSPLRSSPFLPLATTRAFAMSGVTLDAESFAARLAVFQDSWQTRREEWTSIDALVVRGGGTTRTSRTLPRAARGLAVCLSAA